MALYAIGDTHLSGGVEKPMDIFGGSWTGYREKLEENLRSSLSDEDLLIIAGDFSWGINLEECLPDFSFLDSLPGKKVFLKGNHDYWWTTVNKMKNFFDKNGLNTLSFLHNNCIFYNGIVLCGTRGWMTKSEAGPMFDSKMLNREAIRLEKSLSDADSQFPNAPKYCFLHYPPLTVNEEITELTGLMQKYRVKRCFYGHLHGKESFRIAFSGIREGVDYRLISADYLNFRPVMLSI